MDKYVHKEENDKFRNIWSSIVGWQEVHPRTHLRALRLSHWPQTPRSCRVNRWRRRVCTQLSFHVPIPSLAGVLMGRLSSRLYSSSVASFQCPQGTELRIPQLPWAQRGWVVHWGVSLIFPSPALFGLLVSASLCLGLPFSQDPGGYKVRSPK